MDAAEPANKTIHEQSKAAENTTLRTLNSFAINLISIPNVEELYWYVAQKVVSRLNFIDCVVYQADEEQTVLTQVAALGDKNPFGRSILNPLVIPFGEGITGQAAATQKAVVIDDLLRDQNYIPDTQPARSEICVPLIFQDRLYGVIDCEHPEPNAFGNAELEILTTVAAMTSAKLELLAGAEESARRYRDVVQSHAELNQEITNRKALEAELHNARKLETVGRLTGKFAHEFNNLLTVISGNLEFMVNGDLSVHERIGLQEAQSAAARGAKLIHDMLAFSQRSHIQSTLTNLNDLVTATCKQKKLVSTIELGLASSLWSIEIDIITARNAILNLIQNALDASPDGSKPLITTGNFDYPGTPNKTFVSQLPPGKYVYLGVKDDGAGIDRNNLQQIFDPFFTTKPVGKGTGLGLSMLLGFMLQLGGTVGVETSRIHGSLFCLYFPVAKTP